MELTGISYGFLLFFSLLSLVKGSCADSWVRQWWLMHVVGHALHAGFFTMCKVYGLVVLDGLNQLCTYGAHALFYVTCAVPSDCFSTKFRILLGSFGHFSPSEDMVTAHLTHSTISRLVCHTAMLLTRHPMPLYYIKLFTSTIHLVLRKTCSVLQEFLPKHHCLRSIATIVFRMRHLEFSVVPYFTRMLSH